MGNVGRQIARPFEYAGRTGSSETQETGRHNVGGQITGAWTHQKAEFLERINPREFKHLLKTQNLPDHAVEHFAMLQFVTVGSRQTKNMILNEQGASLEQIGVAVIKESQQSMKVAGVWKSTNVQFSPPQTVINYRRRNYGFGYRTTDDFSQTIGRGLQPHEMDAIKHRLNSEAAAHSSSAEATNKLS